MARRYSWCSGERTRLACSFRRPRRNATTLPCRRSGNFAMARAPSSAREGACAPQTSGYKSQRVIEFHSHCDHRSLQPIEAQVPAQVLLSSATAARLAQLRRDDGVPPSNVQTDRGKDKKPGGGKGSEIGREKIPA